MRFYRHHIGDYRAATSHLSWDEDAAYRRLLDIYYATEHPLPADVAQVCRLARATSPSQRRAVETVLREFFVLLDDGWHQKRCDDELQKAAGQVAASRENGTKGGRPPKPRDNPDETQQVISGNPDITLPTTHNPIPITQERDARDDARLLLADFEVWWGGFPNKVAKGAGLKAYRAARKLVDAQTLLDGVRRYVASKPTDTPWCNPATWLNGQRWLDQPAAPGVNGHAAGPTMTVAEAEEQRERRQAETIARGIRLASVPDRRVWGWVDRGWLTAEQAQRAGYAA